MEALDWLHLPNLEVPTGVLGVAEMRDGPGGEVVVVEVQPGHYRPCVGTESEGESPGAIASFRAVHESVFGGWRERTGMSGVERGGVVGWLSTDIATAGFFDHLLLAAFVEREPEAYEKWCRSFFDSMDFPHGLQHFGGDGRVPVTYVQSSAGAGHFPVVELLRDSAPVGLEVAFSPVLVDRVDVARELVLARVADPPSVAFQHI